MSIIQTDAFIMPSDPTIIKQIKDASMEMSASFTRVEGEKDFQKEAIAALAEATDIPKKHLNRVVKLFHKSNKEAVVAENESSFELYDRVFGEQQSI